MSLPIKPVTLPSLALFPPELLDYLVNFISNASDLLSLALTNSTFRAIVIPFHLHYRTVRCYANDSAIWNHLLENQRRGQNVHALELYPPTLHNNNIFSRDCLPCIPRIQGAAPKVDSSVTLSAIHQMTHLKSLCWRNPRTRWPFLGPGDGNLAEECWDAVSQHCPELQKVVAKSSRGCCDCAVQRGESQTSTKLFNLRRLTSLSYTVFCTEPGHPGYNSDPLISFLASNPELKILRLSATYIARAQTQPFNPQGLFRLRFPALRTFSLKGRIETIPASLLIDFFHANPLLESVDLGQSFINVMGPTASRTRDLLPSLKRISARPAALVAWFLGDLPDGTARPLVSVIVSFSLNGDLEPNTFFNGMSRAAGEGLEALSISFDIPEPTINWTNLISDISSRCPNIRRLDVKGFRGCFGIPLIEEQSHPNPNTFDYWVAPLHTLRNLELFNVPNGFFEYLVIQTKEKDGKLSFNQDAILSLTHTCPSLRLINEFPDRRFIQKSVGLIYLRPASGSAKLIDLEKYNRKRPTTPVELSDEGQSTDFTWQLYSVAAYPSSPAKEDLWKVFLPHYDSLRFES